MDDHEADIVGLEDRFANLEETLGGVASVTEAFQRGLEGVKGSLNETGKEAAGMSRSISSSMKSAFEGVIFDGERLSDALSSVGRSIAGSAFNQAIAPVQQAVGSSFGGGVEALLSGILPFANGGVMSSGRVGAFARGGVVDGPTHFPMRGGVGLMGEAGPEAIVPLARGSDGKLGIRSGAGGGGGTVNLTMNISTPDANSFRRSQSQVAADMNRAIQSGRRNL